MMTAAYLRYIMRDPSTQIYKRGVAQPGSAPPWGGGGRRFKSSRPDQHFVSLLVITSSLRSHTISAEDVAFHPRMARPSIASLGPNARRGAGRMPARRPTAQGCAVGRPPCPRREAQVKRAIRGVFLFGDFFLDKQEKVTCRGSATHKYKRRRKRLDCT